MVARARSALPYIGLTAIWLLTVGDVLIGRSSLLPAAQINEPGLRALQPVSGPLRFYRDLSPVNFDFAQSYLIADHLRRGGLLQWNPYAGVGTPLLADLQARLLSPFFLPMLLAPSPWAFSIGISLRLLVALLGAYLLFLLLSRNVLLAFALAVAWALGSYFTMYLAKSELAAACFMPWVCWAALRWLDDPGSPIAGGAIPLALATLAGHPSAALLAAALWLALVLLWPAPVALPRRARAAALGGLVVALLVAPLLLPYIYDAGGLTSYKSFSLLKSTVGWREFVAPAGLFAVPPTLLLFWGRAEQPEHRRRRNFALALFALVSALFAVLNLLPPSPANSTILLDYFSPLLTLLLLLALAASQRADAPTLALRPTRWGVAMALIALALRGVQHGIDGHGWSDLLRDDAIATLPATALVVWQLARGAASQAVRRAAAVAIALAALALGPIVARNVADSYREPAIELVVPHPFVDTGLRPTLAHRILVMGTDVNRRPLLPNLAGVWGYADVSICDPIVPTAYLDHFVAEIGTPALPMFWLVGKPPRGDPAALGVGSIITFAPPNRLEVQATGGYLAGWRPDGSAEVQPLPAPELGFRGTWQTMTWQLPTVGQEAGEVEIKFPFFPGFRTLDAAGDVNDAVGVTERRWLKIRTASGQPTVTLLYREDGFWLGLLAHLVGWYVAFRGRRRSTPIVRPR